MILEAPTMDPKGLTRCTEAILKKKITAIILAWHSHRYLGINPLAFYNAVLFFNEESGRKAKTTPINPKEMLTI